ncbi:MAG: carbamoyl-phosphate synthase large subunit, partial [Candidatus Brocadiae bacterium]|nr:carbamoyl-phosphate synthase large subunit [Candidatus Brocadiia bacterium]
NSNPATIMTDPQFAHRTYVEPITAEVVETIIRAERPDALLPTVGGQTALNTAEELAERGVLDELGVEMIGAGPEAIQKAESRERFKQCMEAIGLAVPAGRVVRSVAEALAAGREIGLPVILRPSFTLGGTGGGTAYNVQELKRMARAALDASPIGQTLIEESVIGWKEFELEVMRDLADNVVIICSIENVDPMGVHTGDSITVAPAQTLTDREYQAMRDAAVAIIREIGVETGGSNIQFAVHPGTGRVVVIEMNPRVSRSSALASKATGYPIARVAAKIAIGLRLDEIPNAVTQKTLACFEPTIDYIVTKIPRWPFDKFASGDRKVGTQMKATGEVMSIDRTFEAALLKGIRSLEIGAYGLRSRTVAQWSEMQIEEYLRHATDERLFAVAEAFRRGLMVEEIHDLSHIDRWFLQKIKNVVDLEKEIHDAGRDGLTDELLRRAKRFGFSDHEIADMLRISEPELRGRRTGLKLTPPYKMVDTCAAEFEAVTPYYYSTYETGCEVEVAQKPRVIVIGAGPIRIGQGIEFDYC